MSSSDLLHTQPELLELKRLFLASVALQPTNDAGTQDHIDESELPATAQPLLRALRLQPASAMHYEQLASLAQQHPTVSHGTTAALFQIASDLLPKDREVAFKLVNARKEQFHAWHSSVPGSVNARSDAALKYARKAWLASLRRAWHFEDGKYSITVNHNLGTVLQLMGKKEEAEHYFEKALGMHGISIKRGTAWKELSTEGKESAKDGLMALDNVLAHLGKPRDHVHAIGVRLGLWERPEQRASNYTWGLLACPFHRKDLFSHVAMVEAAAKDIRAEMMSLLRRREDEEDAESKMWFIDHERIVRRPSQWLRRHVGCYTPETAKDAPRTCEAVKRAMRWYYGAAPGGAASEPEPFYLKAQISILAPGAHITSHTGPTNERLVISLGLAGVEQAKLRVGQTWMQWTQGEAILFDDSFEHEVRHEGELPRAVLIVHFRHPQLMPPGTNGAHLVGSAKDTALCAGGAVEPQVRRAGASGALPVLTEVGLYS